jgi:hypothetical protein
MASGPRAGVDVGLVKASELADALADTSEEGDTIDTQQTMRYLLHALVRPVGAAPDLEGSRRQLLRRLAQQYLPTKFAPRQCRHRQFLSRLPQLFPAPLTATGWPRLYDHFCRYLRNGRNRRLVGRRNPLRRRRCCHSRRRVFNHSPFAHAPNFLIDFFWESC